MHRPYNQGPSAIIHQHIYNNLIPDSPSHSPTQSHGIHEVEMPARTAQSHHRHQCENLTPTISVNDTTNAEEEREHFKLCISLRIAETTQPGQAITICTNGSVFAKSHPEGGLDTLAQKKASLSSTSDNSRGIQLGMFIIHHRPDPERSSDLKERPWTQLLTIPAEGEVVIIHDLPLARMFKYEQRLKPADVVGETWRANISDCGIGTRWWCWGSLDGELKDKRLSAWRDGPIEHHTTPKPMGDEWVLGRHPMELVFEDRTEDASFRFVE